MAYSKKLRRMLGCAIVLGLALLGLFGRAQADDLVVPDSFIINQTPANVPDLIMRNDDDQPVALAAMRGHFVLLSFWATWCGPCLEEMPSLNQLQGDLGGSRFQVVPVSIEGRYRLPKIDWFMKTYRLSRLPVFALDQKTDQRNFDIEAVPTSLLIDPQGRELWRAIGPVEWDDQAARAMIMHYVGGGE